MNHTEASNHQAETAADLAAADDALPPQVTCSDGWQAQPFGLN